MSSAACRSTAWPMISRKIRRTRSSETPSLAGCQLDRRKHCPFALDIAHGSAGSGLGRADRRHNAQPPGNQLDQFAVNGVELAAQFFKVSHGI